MSGKICFLNTRSATASRHSLHTEYAHLYLHRNTFYLQIYTSLLTNIHVLTYKYTRLHLQTYKSLPTNIPSCELLQKRDPTTGYSHGADWHSIPHSTKHPHSLFTHPLPLDSITSSSLSFPPSSFIYFPCLLDTWEVLLHLLYTCHTQVLVLQGIEHPQQQVQGVWGSWKQKHGQQHQRVGGKGGVCHSPVHRGIKWQL